MALLFLTYYATALIVTLALGFLLPWEPPVAEDAPRRAVLRVIAPEGEPYEITWGNEFFRDRRDRVPLGEFYVDYPVPDEAVETVEGDEGDGINARVEAGILISEEPAEGVEDISLGTILFVDGEYAQCDGGSDWSNVSWESYEGSAGPVSRGICGSHRWANTFPDPMAWVGL